MSDNQNRGAIASQQKEEYIGLLVPASERERREAIIEGYSPCAKMYTLPMSDIKV
jgi:hypothetical protein